MSYDTQPRFRGRSGPQRPTWNNSNRQRNFTSRRQHSPSPSRPRTPTYSRSPSRSPPPHHTKLADWDCPCNFNRHGDRILVSFARLHGFHGLSEARLFQRLPELDSIFVCSDTLQELLALMLNVPESSLRLSTPRQVGQREFIASVQLAPGMRVHCQSLSKEGSVRGALLHGILAALDPNTPLPESSVTSVNEFRFPLPPPRPPADLSHLLHAGDPNELFTKNRITELFLHELAELRENSLHPETLADRPDDASASRSLALLGVPQPFVNYSRNGQGDLWQARAITKHVVACGHGTDVGLARQAALLHLLVLIVRGHQPCPVWDGIKKGSKNYAQIKTLKTTIDDICAQRKARANVLDSHRSHRSASLRRSRSPSGPRHHPSRVRSPLRSQGRGIDNYHTRSRSRSRSPTYSLTGSHRQRDRSPPSHGSSQPLLRSSSAFHDHNRATNNGQIQPRDRSPFRPSMHRQRNPQRVAPNNNCREPPADVRGEENGDILPPSSNVDSSCQSTNAEAPYASPRQEPIMSLSSAQYEVDHYQNTRVSPSPQLSSQNLSSPQSRTIANGITTSPVATKYRSFSNDQTIQELGSVTSSKPAIANLGDPTSTESSAVSPTLSSLCYTMERNANLSSNLTASSPKRRMSVTHPTNSNTPSGEAYVFNSNFSEPIDRIAALESMVGRQNSMLLQLQGVISHQQTTLNALIQRERQRIATITAMGGSVSTPPPAPLTFNLNSGSPSLVTPPGPLVSMPPPAAGITRCFDGAAVASTGNLQDKS